MLQVLSRSSRHTPDSDAAVAKFFRNQKTAQARRCRRACVVETCREPAALLPAVVRVRLVGLGHLLHVVTTLHRGTEAVGGVHDLVGEALCHGLLAAGT